MENGINTGRLIASLVKGVKSGVKAVLPVSNGGGAMIMRRR